MSIDIPMKTLLKSNLKDAMKAQDRVRMETIRSLLSDIQYEEMQKGVDDLPDADCLTIVQRALKKRQEEVQFAEQAKRTDLTDKLALEMAAIESFLPKQISAEELEKIVTKLKSENDALTLSLAMKHLKDNYSGTYDGKVASEVVKRVLS